MQNAIMRQNVQKLPAKTHSHAEYSSIKNTNNVSNNYYRHEKYTLLLFCASQS